MEVVGVYSAIQEQSDDKSDFTWDAGPVYELNVCPACDGVTLRRYYYHDAMDPSEIEYKTLHPTPEKLLRGLPKKIEKGYQASLRVRNIDANAYGVLLGRVLDSVCEDRHATGGTLDERLRSLADKGEIPAKLVKVAAGIRKLRNIGAHADLGELTPADLPVLDDLTRAILEYVYSAPLLASEAEARFEELKKRSTRKAEKRQKKGT
jgi:hypothetical protein